MSDSFDPSPSQIQVIMMLADAAQVADGKLYVLGAGITLVSPSPSPLAIAVKVDVPWDRAGQAHAWLLELLDADGMPVLIGDQPVIVQGQFEVARTEHLLPGIPLPMPLAVNFSGLALPAEQRFVWRLAIDGETEPSWQVAFSVAPQPTIDV